ncbi:MAG: DNA methyltransferase [Bacillota bacterium]
MVRRSKGEAAGDAEAVDPRNTLNEMTGSAWLYFTKSLLVTAYPSDWAHDLRREHGACKPPELMKQLIEFFTTGSGRVLDPFAGVGGTLLGASLCVPPRRAVGVEIAERWVEVYRRVLKRLAAEGRALPEQEMLTGDCLEVLRRFPEGHFQFIATDPPYNVHLERTMCDGKYDESHTNRRTDYNMRSDDPADLANLETYEDYLAAMERVFRECLRVLEPGRYMALIVRNAYQSGRYMFTHADLAGRAERAGFVPKGEIVWYQAGSRLRPYGYPYAYVPNIAHQYIVVLRKPPSRPRPARRPRGPSARTPGS